VFAVGIVDDVGGDGDIVIDSRVVVGGVTNNDVGDGVGYVVVVLVMVVFMMSLLV